jgi:SOS response regulatory protein OraA/RecX
MAAAKLEKLIAAKDRSACQFRERLLQEGFEADVVDMAITRASECGLIDDRRFACAYANRKLVTGWGRGRIICELGRMGVDYRCDDELVALLMDDEDELQRATERLHSFTPRAKNPRDARIRHLISKGFNPQIAQTATAKFDAI